MTANILITGAAGYIGGSLVADFLASTNPSLKAAKITAAVRSDEQAAALRTLPNVDVVQLDLTDEKAAADVVLKHNIDIVIQTASSISPNMSLPLISALGKRKESTGKATYFLHTSGLSAFYQATGWEGETSDRDPVAVFETAKKLKDSFPIRTTDVSVIEHSKAVGVTSFIVVPSLVFGRGTGPWNQLSVIIPRYIEKSIEHRTLFKYADEISVPYIHVSDLSALFASIVTNILPSITAGPEQAAAIPPANENSFYFGITFQLQTSRFQAHLAKALKQRDLVDSEEVQVWRDDKHAAEIMGVPEFAVKLMWGSGGIAHTNTASRLPGWQPTRDERYFLDNIDDEVKDTLELGQPKSSLVASLNSL